MSSFLGLGTSVLFGNTVRASTVLLTDCIEPITPGGTIKIIGFGGGHVVTNFTELLEALALVSAAGGGCIILSSTTFFVNQTIVLPPNTSIKGCNCESSVLQATPTLVGPIVSSTSDNVGLHDLKVDHAAQTTVDHMISLSGCDGVNLSDVLCANAQSSHDGIRLSGCTKVNVKCCKFEGGAGEGLNVNACSEVQVTGCLFKDLAAAASVVGFNNTCSNYTFGHNKVKNCRLLTFAGNNYNITGNTFNELVLTEGIICSGDNFAISGNDLDDVSGSGILINGGVTGCTISGNSVRNASVGIRIFGPATVVGNTITSNTGGNDGINVNNNTGTALIKDNTIEGYTNGIVVGTTGNDDVCVCNNHYDKLYSAAGAINPFDSQATVLAAGLLAMTLAEIPKCSVHQCICIENDAGSAANVEVTYNSGADKIILLPTQNKVLCWNGAEWCVINKDCLEATVGPTLIPFNVSTPVDLTIVSSSDNFSLSGTTDILVNTTGKYLVSVYTEFTAGANPPAAALALRETSIMYNAIAWGQQNVPRAQGDPATFMPTNSVSAIVTVSDVTLPITITCRQTENIVTPPTITDGRLQIARL